MKRLFLLFGILFLSITLIGAGAVAAETTENEYGVIEGTVLLEEETPVPNQEIKLQGYEDIDQLLNENKTVTYNETTNQDGEYIFEDLNTSHIYQLSSEYQGISYEGTTLEFGENETKITQNLTVHETTEETDDLVITDEGHLIFIEKDEENGLNVLELITFQNTGDKTINTTLPLDIPSQSEITMTVPEDMERTEKGLETHATIQPGQEDMFYLEYHLDVDIDEFQFEKEILYETHTIGVLAEAEEFSYGETQNLMMFEDTQEMDGEEYEILIAGAGDEHGGLSIGDTIMFDIQEETEIGTWVYLAVFALILTSMVLVWKRDIITSKITGNKTTTKKQGKGLLEQEKEDIFSQMDNLEKEHRRNEINDEEYRERRKELQKQAIDVMKKIEERDSKEN